MNAFSPDHQVASIAVAQHGVVSLPQLLSAGLTKAMVLARVRRGRLHRVHQSVYAVGHPPRTREAHWIAAVFACGVGALLSHRSAGSLWEIRESSLGRIDVTAPGRRGRRRSGLLVHRGDTLTEADRTTRRGIPVTTLERTVIDLATVIHTEAVEYAIHRAEHRRKLKIEKLEAVTRRLPGHRGAAKVRRIIGAADPRASRTRGWGERRFLRICREHGIPMPQTNTWIAVDTPAGGVEVDFCWPAERLVVEIDDAGTHRTDRAFTNDRARDRALVAAGWRPMRFPEEETRERPAEIAVEVLDVLARPDSARRP